MILQPKLLVSVFKLIQHSCEIFQNVKPALQNNIATNIQLGKKIITKHLPFIARRFCNLLYKPMYGL